MTIDGSYTGVLDRFEDDQAVLVLERDGETVDELVVDREELPEEAGPDAVLRLVVDHGHLVDAAYDESETIARRDAAQDRFDRLAERPPDDDE